MCPFLQSQPRACSDNWPVLAVSWDLDIVQATEVVTKRLTIIYDQIISIKLVHDHVLVITESD